MVIYCVEDETNIRERKGTAYRQHIYEIVMSSLCRNRSHSGRKLQILHILPWTDPNHTKQDDMEKNKSILTLLCGDDTLTAAATNKTGRTISENRMIAEGSFAARDRGKGFIFCFCKVGCREHGGQVYG